MKARRPFPAGTVGTLVFDAGGLDALVTDRVATTAIRLLLDAGWEPIIPAPVLVEALHGDSRRDAALHRVIAAISISPCDESRARHAATLRRPALRTADPSAVDAIVASHAVQNTPSIVVTTDAADLGALLAAAPLVKILAV